MINVITPTYPVKILKAIVFKETSGTQAPHVNLPFTMLKGKSFSINYFAPISKETIPQVFGYSTSSGKRTCTVGIYSNNTGFSPQQVKFNFKYPTTTTLLTESVALNGTHVLSVTHNNDNKVTLSISDVGSWEATISDFSNENIEEFHIGNTSYTINIPGFKIYSITLGGVTYLPAITDISVRNKNIVGYYDPVSNLFYHNSDTTTEYDYEELPTPSPQDEFIQLFPNAVVQESSKLRYNDGDVPVEAYKVFKTREALMASKVYQGEIVAIVEDPMYNGLYHIVGDTAKRLGFLY